MAKTINIVNRNSVPVGIGRTTFGAAGYAVKSVLAYALETLLTWQERARQRRQLAELDPRILRDIGISRSDAEREYRKKFWQA